jgi:sortase A
MKPWLRRVGGVLLVAALVQAAVALYPLAKGALAMQLIARSYARAPGARPWPGADFRVAARLEVPRLRVEQHLLDSMSARALAFGPGLAPSAPGQGLIASAHRDSHFAWLREVEDGDTLWLEQGGARRSYVVLRRDVVDPARQRLVAPADGVLVLTTCWPFEALGSTASQRYVVTAVATDLAVAGQPRGPLADLGWRAHGELARADTPRPAAVATDH